MMDEFKANGSCHGEFAATIRRFARRGRFDLAAARG